MDFLKNNLSSLIIGLSIIIFGILLSISISSIGEQKNTINVTGSASKIITSDFGVLRIKVEANDNNRINAFTKLQHNISETLNFIENEGIDKSLIEAGTIENYTEYIENKNKIPRYNFSQTFEIKLNDIQKIKTIASKITSLNSNGIDIYVHPPLFYYSKLQELKSEVQAEATKDAINRANKILSSTNNKLGSIKNVRTGVLQITAPYSTEISDYGMNDEYSVEKKITAVVNITFGIK
ncbi:MAG TPA: SIMPL domain-containing protein [Ignavibacteriales bacterium]|nr:SIMPL domain-containing protein [Ignavibacteriales bacterium]